MLDHVGFDDGRWGLQIDGFAGSKHESSAAAFDTFGVTFGAVRRG